MKLNLLFQQTGSINLVPCNGEALYFPDFLASEEQRYFSSLLTGVNWQFKQIRLFGKWVDQPRLISWYGDSGTEYSYSGITMQPQPFTPVLAELKEILERHCGHSFNSVLANLYRNGNDSMGWHSDDEKELGVNPVIASLSFGAERKFCLKHRFDKSLKKEVYLSSGSLLLMKGELQHYWMHALPKTQKVWQPRINLTFRSVNQNQTPSAVITS